MKEINDGGPAFPVKAVPENYFGMTLRDYFAAKAMQGMLADPLTRESCPEGKQDKWIRSFANACYNFADAMLEARERQP